MCILEHKSFFSFTATNTQSVTLTSNDLIDELIDKNTLSLSDESYVRLLLHGDSKYRVVNNCFLFHASVRFTRSILLLPLASCS